MQKRSSNPGNKTPKRGQGPPDPNVLAFNIVQQATGQASKVKPDEGKNPAAVDVPPSSVQHRTRIYARFNLPLRRHISPSSRGRIWVKAGAGASVTAEPS